MADLKHGSRFGFKRAFLWCQRFAHQWTFSFREGTNSVTKVVAALLACFYVRQAGARAKAAQTIAECMVEGAGAA